MGLQDLKPHERDVRKPDQRQPYRSMADRQRWVDGGFEHQSSNGTVFRCARRNLSEPIQISSRPRAEHHFIADCIEFGHMWERFVDDIELPEGINTAFETSLCP